MFKKKQQVNIQPQTLKQLEDAFKLYDDNSRGTISGSQFKSILRAFGFKVKKINVKEMLKKQGLDYQSKITERQFYQMMSEILPPRHSKQHYQRIFKLFDIQNKGKLSPNQIIRIAESIGQYISSEQIKTIFQKGDIDKDGLLNFNDFYFLVKPSDQE